ncbi:hypothetical protein [Virgibacillus alimentarius]|uniref:hypothetical protein n=1 Tax=Virgibacillus alimentarius TaxID=698769 RepID=UPI000AB81138|nr:hypothetical protein [Virgibacillus alimentarius]
MVIAFQIILLIIMIVSFMALFSDEDIDLKINFSSVCMASILAFLVTVLWL